MLLRKNYSKLCEPDVEFNLGAAIETVVEKRKRSEFLKSQKEFESFIFTEGSIFSFLSPIPREDLPNTATRCFDKFGNFGNSIPPKCTSVVYQFLDNLPDLYCVWGETFCIKERYVMQPYCAIYPEGKKTTGGKNVVKGECKEFPSVIFETFYCFCNNKEGGECREKRIREIKTTMNMWLSRSTTVQMVFVLLVGEDDNLTHKVFFKKRRQKTELLRRDMEERAGRKVYVPTSLIYFGVQEKIQQYANLNLPLEFPSVPEKLKMMMEADSGENMSEEEDGCEIEDLKEDVNGGLTEEEDSEDGNGGGESGEEDEEED